MHLIVIDQVMDIIYVMIDVYIVLLIICYQIIFVIILQGFYLFIKKIRCSVGFSCISSTPIGWDVDYLILQIFLIYFILSYAFTLISAIIFNKKIMMIKKLVEKYENYRIRKNISGIFIY